MTQFVSINGTRIRISTIKRYAPISDTKLAVYYSASRSKIEQEIFKFDDQASRDEMLETIDGLV